MKALADWPALAARRSLPDALPYERAIWGKVHAVGSDFRWIASSSDLAGAEPESSIAGEEVRYRLRDSEPPFRESQVIFRLEPNEDGGTRFRIIQQACEERVKLPQPANSNCCLIRAAA